MKKKIAALIRKANSSTHQSEAETFLKKAQDLMEKHHISMADLTEAERTASDPMGVNTSNRYTDGTPAAVKYMLLSTVSKYFGCVVILDWELNPKSQTYQNVVKYHGPESARTTTDLMFPFIWKQVNELARQHGGTRAETRKLQRDISRSLSRRIASLIEERKNDRARESAAGSSTALVLVGVDVQTQSFVDELYGDTLGKPKTRRYKATSYLARSLAQQVSLDQQVGGSQKNVDLLT